MQTRLSNCLFFAIRMWLQRPKTSYVAMRWSHYYPGPHFLWAKRYRDGRVKFVSLVPPGAKTKRICPPCLFLGVLKRGDD